MFAVGSACKFASKNKINSRPHHHGTQASPKHMLRRGTLRRGGVPGVRPHRRTPLTLALSFRLPSTSRRRTKRPSNAATCAQQDSRQFAAPLCAAVGTSRTRVVSMRASLDQVVEIRYALALGVDVRSFPRRRVNDFHGQVPHGSSLSNVSERFRCADVNQCAHATDRDTCILSQQARYMDGQA